MDPLQTETARFWENYGEHNDVDASSIKTEVIELPTTCFAEETGSLVNSGRWLQWHWAGGTPPGEAKHDNWIMGNIFLRLRALYQKEGGTVPEPIVNLSWRYKDPSEPTPEELAKELNGYANEDITDPNDPTKVVIARDKQLVNFSVLRDDGKTTCGCWIYSGRGRGRSIDASFTIGPRPTSTAIHGIRPANSCGGTAASGPATMFPTLRPTPSRTSSARSS